jgi:glycosyltransferase involved in cell wall biosynthesis
MNLLFHLLDAEVAGGQMVALHIAAAVAEEGHGIGVLVPSGGPMVDRFEGVGARTHFLPLSSLGRPWAIRRAAVLVRGYDVLYSHTSAPGQILGDAAARLAGRPHVIHQHSAPYFSRRRLAASVQRVLFQKMRAARFMAVADHVAGSLLATGVDGNRIVVVPNGGPDVNRLTRPPPRDGKVRVGLVARLDPGKGIDEFVEAVTPLAGNGVVAEIAGQRGPFEDYERALEERLRGSPVRLVEPDPDGSTFLAGLDVVAIPSHYEGSPLTLFEAMALGRAVVATTIPGIREVIDDGRNGLLVPAGDARALGLALGRLVEDASLRERLGATARRDVRGRFPMSRTVERCVAILEEVVDASKEPV